MKLKFVVIASALLFFSLLGVQRMTGAPPLPQTYEFSVGGPPVDFTNVISYTNPVSIVAQMPVSATTAYAIWAQVSVEPSTYNTALYPQASFRCDLQVLSNNTPVE